MGSPMMAEWIHLTIHSHPASQKGSVPYLLPPLGERVAPSPVESARKQPALKGTPLQVGVKEPMQPPRNYLCRGSVAPRSEADSRPAVWRKRPPEPASLLEARELGRRRGALLPAVCFLEDPISCLRASGSGTSRQPDSEPFHLCSSSEVDNCGRSETPVSVPRRSAARIRAAAARPWPGPHPGRGTLHG